MCVSFRSVVCVGEEKGEKEDCRPSASLCASYSGSEMKGQLQKEKVRPHGGSNHPRHKTQPAFHLVCLETHMLFSHSYFSTDAWLADDCLIESIILGSSLSQVCR